MSIHAALFHRTRYTYDRPVNHAPHVIRLRPAPHCRTPIRAYSLKIHPARHFINWQQDPHGNYLARVVFPEPTTELDISVEVVAEMSVYNPFDFFLEGSAETHPFDYDEALRKDLLPYLEQLPASPRLDALASELRATCLNRRTIDVLVTLNQRLQHDISYLIRMEPGVQSPERTLELRSGSCRDSAWLLVQLLRRLGLAARFVSGYLIQLAPDVKSLDGPSGTEIDFTDLHAWCEVFLPGAGWIGLDPTSGLLAGEGHIPLAATPEPSTAAPVTGAVDECESKLDHTMRVTRIHESPRVTKPYTDAQWDAINALGRQIDASLVKGDVRLTMGGEPTFVSIDDMDGAEWNTAALGPTKHAIGSRLIRRLKERFAQGGLLFFGQGKWYPGESLPRWAKSCYWRKDGKPLWQDPSLIAQEDKSYGHGISHAEVFSRALVKELGVEEQWLMPAYEDSYYYLWKERRLPSNVDPLRSNLSSPEDRARIARVFERGLDAKVGLVLPLQPNGDGAWASGPWFLRDETLWLIPGDSPIGFRLPLESLPWVSDRDHPWVIPEDPMAPRGELPECGHPRQPVHSHIAAGSPGGEPARGGRCLGTPGDALRAPLQQESAAWVIRTALCVEPREGRLHVFMPPLRTLEDYLALVSSIEAAAGATGLPVILEGTPPPHDPRIEVVKVTPDPGVLEVNLQPASGWDDLVSNTRILYEEARLARLGTEKFMIDGRHTGTGGGNHIVIGGPTPADSPLLRRPDLLRSLVSYWHNHPSLSYLFSGLCIGPTSQAPRVDEARNDALYELEIAMAQHHGGQAPVPPWLIDRLYRNLLIDVSGNTHRAEFCIDKLYSPDSASGRLGLLELRNFEMPPHERMSLAQQLLLRGLVARFWETPFKAPLTRWGTELHDRFMLHHWVERDLNEVLNDLREAGMPFRDEWFAPHLEFRFPIMGELCQRGITMDLRNALEPWHVMGEEPGAGGTVRFVDSSVERLQVHVTGFNAARFRVACNGRTVPLHPTGTIGEYVAGVRYRAWQPPSCLHPTIAVHSPLVFDLVDTWNNRSIGGCTSHVAHPGGRNYSTFPVNAYEAESRRLARFHAHGHTPGPMTIPPAETNPDFPFTLDLRRPVA